MRIIECDQGSVEWQRAHVGRPSASQFHRIITPKTRKPSASQDRYLADILASWALDLPMDDRVTQFMERGKDLEQAAVDWYEFNQDRDAELIGFALHDTLDAGCSPDRLVGEDGLLEVKCPSAPIHVMYLLGFDSVMNDYRCQAQGQLWITGREWIDLLSYNPSLPPVLHRVERDEEFISALSEHVEAFCERVAEGKDRLLALGLKVAA